MSSKIEARISTELHLFICCILTILKSRKKYINIKGCGKDMCVDSAPPMKTDEDKS
jgi:hypothetical protein